LNERAEQVQCLSGQEFDNDLALKVFN